MGIFDDQDGILSGASSAFKASYDKADKDLAKEKATAAPAPMDIKPPAAQPTWLDNLRESQFWGVIPSPFQNMITTMYDHFGSMNTPTQVAPTAPAAPVAPVVAQPPMPPNAMPAPQTTPFSSQANWAVQPPMLPKIY